MTEKTLDQAKLRQWIGRSEETSDTITLPPAQRMEATLDRPAQLRETNTLPLCWHWLYFLQAAPMGELGRDGHPALGSFLPPVALPRRMWAGGRLQVTQAPRFGERVTRRSTITDVKLKTGRSGPLCFITLRHDHTAGEEHRFTEEQDLVYRADPAPDAPAAQPTAPPTGSVISETITPNPTQLFRYSALTFNGHRIHYDVDYCRDVEGYPGLVFHGPLTATLLADLALRHGGGRAIERFDFRAVHPLFDTRPFTLHFDGAQTVWAETPDGGLAMEATVIFSG